MTIAADVDLHRKPWPALVPGADERRTCLDPPDGRALSAEEFVR